MKNEGIFHKFRTLGIVTQNTKPPTSEKRTIHK